MDRYRAHDKDGVEIGILDLEAGHPDRIQWAASVGLLDVRLIEKRIGGESGWDLHPRPRPERGGDRAETRGPA